MLYTCVRVYTHIPYKVKGAWPVSHGWPRRRSSQTTDVYSVPVGIKNYNTTDVFLRVPYTHSKYM